MFVVIHIQGRSVITYGRFLTAEGAEAWARRYLPKGGWHVSPFQEADTEEQVEMVGAERRPEDLIGG